MKKAMSVLLAVSVLTIATAAMAVGGSVMAQEKFNRKMASDALVQRLYGQEDPTYIKGEPELSTVMRRHIYGDVRSKIVNLTLAQQELLTIAALTAIGTPEDVALHVEGALRAAASPAEVRETLFQCTPYVGLPRVKNAMAEMHKAFNALGIKTPLPDNGTVSEADRYAKGLAVQEEAFGSGIRAGYAAAPEDSVHLNYFLSQNCFGDFYTRTELDLRQRELITFAVIAALGGCEQQLRAHTAGNLTVGNSRQDLIDVITLLQPYNGYPRTLNALSVVNSVAPAKPKS